MLVFFESTQFFFIITGQGKCLVRQYVREPNHATYCILPPHLEISSSYIPGIILSFLVCILPLLTLYLGSHLAVLSTAAHGISIRKETVPFTPLLLHQHGEPVQCIPFSTSPFSVLDTAASHLPSRSITISEDLSIDPSSVKPNLVKTTNSNIGRFIQ